MKRMRVYGKIIMFASLVLSVVLPANVMATWVEIHGGMDRGGSFMYKKESVAPLLPGWCEVTVEFPRGGESSLEISRKYVRFADDTGPRGVVYDVIPGSRLAALVETVVGKDGRCRGGGARDGQCKGHGCLWPR